MKISIITVCFNSAETIEQTIKSVITQSYSNVEYIIIDGGSTDGTLSIIERYASFITYFISEPDSGIYDAMNKGINLASGDIVGIINSDDWYSPNIFEKIIEHFKDSSFDVAYGDLTYVYPDGKHIVATAETVDCSDMHYRNVLWHPTVFVNRKMYLENGNFNCRFKIFADYQFLLRLYNKNARFYYIPLNIAYFRTNGFHSKMRWNTITEERRVALQALDNVEESKRVLVTGLINTHYEENMKYVVREYIENRIRKYFGVQRYFIEVLRLLFNDDIKRICIFGAGEEGKKCYQYFHQSKISVMCFIDNATNKQNKMYKKIPIKRLSDLQEIKGQVKFIIASQKYGDDMRKELEYNGLSYGKDFLYFLDLQNKLCSMYVHNLIKKICSAN